jgi:hypothetical protein
MKRSRSQKVFEPKKSVLIQLRWIILLLFPIGWWLTRKSFPESLAFQEKFTDLTGISFVASFFILSRLKLSKFQNEGHLWTIYLIFLIGHYIKFYLMMYWKVTGNKNLTTIYLPSTVSLLSSPEIVINAYTITTVSLCAFSIGVYFATKNIKLTLIENYLQQQFSQVVFQSRYKKWLTIYVFIGILISLFLLYIQSEFRIGARIDPTNLGSQLPFKLTGIIHYSNSLLIPAIFLLLIFLADKFNNRLALRIGVVFYFIHAAMATVITTSKGPIPMAMASLAIVWGLSDRFTRGRRTIFIAAIPLLSFVFSIASSLRALREIGEVGSLAKLPEAIAALSELSQDGSSSSSLVFVTRVIGVENLFNISSYFNFYDVQSNPNWTQEILFNSQLDINDFFAIKVLGIKKLIGLGVSAGLTGSFYLVVANIWLVGLCIFIYTILWHTIFQRISNMPLVTKPIALAQICVLAAGATSEGSLNALPYQIVLILGIILLGECAARILLGIPLIPKKKKFSELNIEEYHHLN